MPPTFNNIGYHIDQFLEGYKSDPLRMIAALEADNGDLVLDDTEKGKLEARAKGLRAELDAYCISYSTPTQIKNEKLTQAYNALLTRVRETIDRARKTVRSKNTPDRAKALSLLIRLADREGDPKFVSGIAHYLGQEMECDALLTMAAQLVGEIIVGLADTKGNKCRKIEIRSEAYTCVDKARLLRIKANGAYKWVMGNGSRYDTDGNKLFSEDEINALVEGCIKKCPTK